MKSCALLTTTGLDEQVLDDDRFEKALSDLGWKVQWINWRESDVDWDQFDCAVIRTTWDYIEDIDLFLGKIQAIEKSSCKLFNSFEIVRWNSKKTYLKNLNEAGVNIVPTMWLNVKSSAQLSSAIEEMECEKVVIKPQVGAGAKNTFMLKSPTEKSLDDVVTSLKNEDVMLQPFMEMVRKEGEFSAHFFNKQFSHIILKTPKKDDFRSQEEFGSNIRRVEITTEQMQFCEATLKAVPQDLLFARVDFINDGHGNPCLIELELVEPSLYFRYDEAAAPKLAKALEDLF